MVIISLFLIFLLFIYLNEKHLSSIYPELDADLISRQYKLILLAHFMRMKQRNPKLKQSERANQLSYSSYTLQRFRNDKNLVLPCRIRPNNTKKRRKKTSNTNFNKFSHLELDNKRPQMTPENLKASQTNTKPSGHCKLFLIIKQLQMILYKF